MSTNLDTPPIYDPIDSRDDFISEVWMSWITTFVQSVSEYLSQYGIFIPQLTQAQINSILSPIEGQMVYNMDVLGPQIWRNGLWRTFSTTP